MSTSHGRNEAFCKKYASENREKLNRQRRAKRLFKRLQIKMDRHGIRGWSVSRLSHEMSRQERIWKGLA